MLELINVSKKFKDGKKISTVLENVNLTINNEDYITIMGESGSGKSTLLNIMTLLLKPSSGEVKINNSLINFSKENELVKYRGKNMGLVFQNPNLISCMNPVENLLFAMMNNKKNKKEYAKKLLDMVGLSDKYNSKIKSLSGGEAQRVSIVRALVNEPEILFCDEPTGALDHENSQNVISILEDVHKKRKCSLVIVTHDKNIWNRGKRKFVLESGIFNEMV